MTKKKIGIFGYARHGKDTVAELICNKLNYSFCSSSYFVCEKAVFPVLSKKYGYHYTNASKFDRFKCNNCGASVRGKVNLLSKDKRASLKANII